LAKNNPPAKEKVTLKMRWDATRQYFASSYRELKKVHWPNRQQLIAYTGVVLFSVLLMSALLWLFDTGLSFVLEKLFDAFA
jgi:preprotein translocase subunit SecE